MNIIQVQDRLKGVTDDALIGYVENPTGQVPTYLALGEIGRREKIRKEYQAQPQSNQTVAEEMVAQLSMPAGIGALTSNMGPEMPPEEVMSSSETISETGIAPLPTPNIGQNYQAGGIVYSDGTQGYPVGGLIVPGLAAAGRYLGGTALGKGVKSGLSSLFRGARPAVKDPSAVIQRGIPNAPGRNISLPQAGPGMPAINRGLLRQPGTYIDTAIIGGITYGVLPNGETEKITEEEKDVIDTNNASEQLTETVTETEPEPTMEDKARKRMELFKEFAGEDEGAARIPERMAKMEERTADVEDQAFNDALIDGGFAMVAGKDQNFLRNVATGGQKLTKSYSDSMDKVRELEKETFAIDVELNKAKRTEKLAIASKGIDSIEAQEAAERASALQAQKDNAALARIKATVAAGQQLTEGDLIDAYTASGGYDSVTQQTLPYQQWKRNLLEQLPADTPEIQSLVDKYAS
mgnify:CR=1 FL=1